LELVLNTNDRGNTRKQYLNIEELEMWAEQKEKNAVTAKIFESIAKYD
jgi:hypothetical protein